MKRTCKRWLISALSILALCLLPFPARAQFIGYTSPQTVQQNLTSGSLACTGATQSFNVQNLGQTQHIATLQAIPAPTSLKMAIFGIDTAGFNRQISDTGYPDSLTAIVTVSASGYYPAVQIQVVCTGGSFTLQYTGTSSNNALNVGATLQGSLFKQLANAAPANTNLTTTLATPNGSSVGQIAFTYAAAGPAASTLTLTCTNSASVIPGSPFTLNTSATAQIFYIAALPCPNVTVLYTSGGASATTFVMVYDFIPPGTPPTADPCASPGIPKSSAVVTAAAAATTQIIAASGNTVVYACGYQISQAVLAGTVQWTTGTGGTCGAATVTKTGAMQTIVGQPFTNSGPGTVFSTAPGSAVCLTTTGAGATAAGIVSFVQQ